jgi:outer membrane protein TolC
MIAALLSLQVAATFSAAAVAPRIQAVPDAGGSPAFAIRATDSIPVLTLAEALRRAVRLNPDYVSALGAVSEAEWSRKAARVAFFVPAVSASLDWTKYSDDFFNIGTLTPASTSATATLAASYELFSARKFTELGRSQAELEALTQTAVQRQFAAALLTESAFYAVLGDAELERVAAERATRAEAQLVLARARVSSGAAVQSDSLTVRLELLRAQVNLRRRQSALRVARLELGRRVGLDGPVGAAPLAGTPGELPLTVEQAVMSALESGPAYRAARAGERAAEAQLKGARGAYLPTLTLTAAHNRFDVELFPNAFSVSSITLGLSLPIWNNGQREFSIIRARSQRDYARALRSDLERSALRDVSAAYDLYETSRAEAALAQEAEAVARENYRVEEARYRAGATPVLNLIEAQNGLSDAEAQVVTTRYAQRLALAALEAILGRRIGPELNGGDSQ